MRTSDFTFPEEFRDRFVWEFRARLAWIIEALELGDVAEALVALRALEEELT